MNPDLSVLNASPDIQSIGNTLALLNSHQNASQGGGQSTPTPAVKPGGGGILGFLGRNASTIGGIGGGIAGELIDPFGGGVAGAALGSSLGKAVQNEDTGQSVGSGVLGAGVEGGLGQAAGFGAGKLLGGLGGKLVSGAANAVAKRTAPDAAADAAKAATKTGLFNNAFSGFEKQNEPVRQMLESHGVDTDLSNAGASANEAAQNLRGKAETLSNAIVSPIQQIRDEEVLKAGAGKTVELPSDVLQNALKSVNANAGPLGKQHIINPVEDVSDEEKAVEAAMPGSTGRPTIKTSGKNPIVNTADDLVTDLKNAIESPGPSGEPGLTVDPNTGEVNGSVSTEHALNILNQISKTADKHYQALTDSNGTPITGSAKGITTKILSDAEKSLQDTIYNQPGVMEGIQGRAGEAADATRDQLTKAGFDNDQIDKAVESSANILDSGETTEMGGKMSPLISNARVARGANKVASNSGAAREDVETAAAKAAKPPASAPTGGSPALSVAHAIPGGALLKGLGAGITHFATNPAAMAGAGGVLSKLAPVADGNITGAGMALGGLGASAATGPLTNPPTTAAPAGQFTNTNDETGAGGTTMQPGMQPSAQASLQPAQSNPMGSAMLNYALFNPTLLSTMMTTANQQSGQNYAGQQAQSALSNLPAAPSGIGAEIESKLGVGSASRYNAAAQQAATQIAAAIPGTDAGTIAKELTNYMAGGANIQQAQQALLQQLQLQQQQTQSGLSGLLAPAGLTQQPTVGLTPSLSATQ